MAGKRVRVDPRVPGQLVRAGEALEAPGEVALVGLFARVCSDVAGLVLEPVERLLAQRTLVGPGLRRRRRRRAAAGRRGGLGVVCSGHAGCAAGLLWGRGCSAAGALADGPGQHAKRGTLLAADCFWVSPGTHGGLCTPPAVHRHHHPVFWIPRASSQARCNRHNPTLRKRLALPLPLAFSRPRLPLVFSPGARNEEKGGGESGREFPPYYVSGFTEKPFAAEKLRARAPVHPFPAFIRRWGERRVARVLRARASFPPGRLSRHT